MSRQRGAPDMTDRPYFIKSSRRTAQGAAIQEIHRFEFEDIRDIVLKGMQASPYYFNITAGKEKEKSQ